MLVSNVPFFVVVFKTGLFVSRSHTVARSASIWLRSRSFLAANRSDIPTHHSNPAGPLHAEESATISWPDAGAADRTKTAGRISRHTPSERSLSLTEIVPPSCVHHHFHLPQCFGVCSGCTVPPENGRIGYPVRKSPAIQGEIHHKDSARINMAHIIV